MRRAIAAKVGADRGIEVDPECVVVYAGGRPPIGLTQHAYLEAGDEVIYPSPGYPLFESFIRYIGGFRSRCACVRTPASTSPGRISGN